MDRSSIINVAKETVLATKSVPTSFFVECKDKPLSNIVMVPCPCGHCAGITPSSCLAAARRMALQHWNAADVLEIGFVTIEMQGGKEELVITFCELTTPEPVFTLHRIKIRRGPSDNIMLLDSGESTPEEHRLLLWFTTGIMTSPLPLEEIQEIVAMLEEAKGRP